MNADATVRKERRDVDCSRIQSHSWPAGRNGARSGRDAVFMSGELAWVELFGCDEVRVTSDEG